MQLTNEGYLLRAGAVDGSFDAGGRGGVFELFDWDGNVIWTYEIRSDQRHAHHDITLLPNGHFLCSIWDRKSKEEAQRAGRIYEGDVWSESILEIEILADNEAHIVWEWSIWDHLIQDRDQAKPHFGNISMHPERLDINYIGEGKETSGNWLHINAIDYNPALDQIVISSRNLSEIYVIDHSTTTAEARTSIGGRQGKGGDILYRYGNPTVSHNGSLDDQILRGQHDIRWIPDGLSLGGAFIVFNNEDIPGEQSSIIIFQSPADDQGSYVSRSASAERIDTIVRSISINGLYSDILSGAQPLPNGNILITEGRPGHFYEISPQNEIVWEYINPVNRNGGPAIQGGEPRFNMIFKATRYSPDFVGFQNRNLEGTSPIELSPLDTDCIIYSSDLSTDVLFLDKRDPEIIINPNPFQEKISIQINSTDEHSPILFSLYNISGQLLISKRHHEESIQINVTDLSPGMYIVRILMEQGQVLTKKVIKS